jgi:hypothetical protein
MSETALLIHTWAPPRLFPREGSQFSGRGEARIVAYRLTFKSFKTISIDHSIFKIEGSKVNLYQILVPK